MNEVRFPRWLAAFGVLGGVAIAVGLPFVVLVYGTDLSSGAKVALMILALLVGGLLSLASAVVGIAVPTVVTGAALDLDRCCPPEPSDEPAAPE